MCIRRPWGSQRVECLKGESCGTAGFIRPIYDQFLLLATVQPPCTKGPLKDNRGHVKVYLDGLILIFKLSYDPFP